MKTPIGFFIVKPLIGSLVVASAALGLAQTQNTFRVIKLPNSNERVTAMHCSSLKSCVIATDSSNGGHIYASDGQKITATLLEGNSDLAQKLGTLGTLGFAGFSKTQDRLVVHVLGAGEAFISATGDITQKASWTSEKIGVQDAGSFGLNQQMGIGTKDNRWLLFTQSTIYESNDMPSPGALWTPVWSPISPSIPKDFAALRRADPKLCAVEPGVPWSPKLTQPAHVAPDLSVVLYPSGARNQRGDDPIGVCVSTDAGKRFYRVDFPAIKGDLGPLGVTCANANRCFAYGGLDYNPESTYIYQSNDTQKGAASTWAAAKLPNLPENSAFRHLAFAPNSNTGWAVGKSGSASPLLLETNDGGASWKDTSASVRALAPNVRLHAVYGFDNTHVWVGGENGTLLTSGY